MTVTTSLLDAPEKESIEIKQRKSYHWRQRRNKRLVWLFLDNPLARKNTRWNTIDLYIKVHLVIKILLGNHHQEDSNPRKLKSTLAGNA